MARMHSLSVKVKKIQFKLFKLLNTSNKPIVAPEMYKKQTPFKTSWYPNKGSS